MIPKIIHYCWFGNAPKPKLIQNCIETWKNRLPDYQIKEWNETNFDFNMAPFCKEAYEAKKWAFVADYCRIYALYTEGGIYMDTDIMVLRSFDEFLKYSFFSSHEYQPWIFEKNKKEYVDERGYILGNKKDEHVPGLGIQSGVMMSEPKSPFMTDCLEYYNSIHLPKDLGKVIVVRLLSKILEKYGYRYTTDDLYLEKYNIRISAPTIFSNMTTLSSKSYAWHMYYRSWGNGFSIKQKLRNNFPRIYVLLQLLFHKKYSLFLIKRIVLS